MVFNAREHLLVVDLEGFDEPIYLGGDGKGMFWADEAYMSGVIRSAVDRSRHSLPGTIAKDKHRFTSQQVHDLTKVPVRAYVHGDVKTNQMLTLAFGAIVGSAQCFSSFLQIAMVEGITTITRYDARALLQISMG